MAAHRGLRSAVAAALAGWAGVCLAAVPLPNDYRLDHYRAPTPAELPGATVLTDAAAVQRLAQGGQIWLVFVESLERSALPPHPWLLDGARTVIPGSVWLPNVGKGGLSEAETAFFRARLDAMRAERPGAGFLFYCYIDCWVSWNAARRALRLGYGPVYWYPDGIDGWLLEGLATEQARPVAPP